MNTLKTILSGLAVGGAMTIPGVSGGSAAMILGIYDDLITAVSRAFSEPRKNLLLLLKFAIGACAGALLIARLITFLLTTPVEVPLRFLFLGAVAGGIPMIFRKAEIRKLTAGSTALILAGVGVVMLISMLPERIFSPDTSGFAAVIMQFLGGLLLAAALVLPGISASHFLLMLGIYDDVMEKLGEFELLALVPLAAGAAVGVFLTAKVLERLLGPPPPRNLPRDTRVHARLASGTAPTRRRSRPDCRRNAVHGCGIRSCLLAAIRKEIQRYCTKTG